MIKLLKEDIEDNKQKMIRVTHQIKKELEDLNYFLSKKLEDLSSMNDPSLNDISKAKQIASILEELNMKVW